MNKVINMRTFRIIRQQRAEECAYRFQLENMDKAQLLQELLNYHEFYIKNPHDFRVTIRGQLLMEILEEKSHLKELQDLSAEFQEKLQKRLETQLGTKKSTQTQ